MKNVLIVRRQVNSLLDYARASCALVPQGNDLVYNSALINRFAQRILIIFYPQNIHPAFLLRSVAGTIIRP